MLSFPQTSFPCHFILHIFRIHQHPAFLSGALYAFFLFHKQRSLFIFPGTIHLCAAPVIFCATASPVTSGLHLNSLHFSWASWFLSELSFLILIFSVLLLPSFLSQRQKGPVSLLPHRKYSFNIKGFQTANTVKMSAPFSRSWWAKALKQVYVPEFLFILGFSANQFCLALRLQCSVQQFFHVCTCMSVLKIVISLNPCPAALTFATQMHIESIPDIPGLNNFSPFLSDWASQATQFLTHGPVLCPLQCLPVFLADMKNSSICGYHLDFALIHLQPSLLWFGLPQILFFFWVRFSRYLMALMFPSQVSQGLSPHQITHTKMPALLPCTEMFGSPLVTSIPTEVDTYILLYWRGSPGARLCASYAF